MKLIIDKHILFGSLDHVSKALPSKAIIEILSGILFKVDESGLTITAGDSSIAITSCISPDDFESVIEGSIVLPGKKILEIVRKLSDEIFIETDGLVATIKSGGSKFELSGLDGNEYPSFPTVFGKTIFMKGSILKSMINKTIHSTSESEVTPILTGVHFQLTSNRISLTSCDRHRLSRVVNDITNEVEISFVISRHSLGELMKMIDEKGDIKLSLADDKFLAETKGFSFYSRVLEGAFPEVEKLLDLDFQSFITVKTSKLIGALEQTYIIAAEEKANQIHITINDDMQIESKVGKGSATVSLDVIKSEGDNFRLSANAKYILELLKTIDSENVIIHYVKEMSPIVFKGEGELNNLQLVLPYRG